MTGWALITILCMFVTAVFLQGAGGMLRLIFPALASGLGAYLYFTSPRLYLGYAWWLWFLVPEIRRIADFQGGWNPVNEIMLTPLLVSSLTLITVVKYAALMRLKSFFPFVPIFCALMYGTLIGAITTGPMVAVYALLTWLAPVLLAFYIIARWADYEAHREVLLTTFGWGAFVMGAYGLIQYFFAPAWDGVWIHNSGMVNQGQPYPQEIRVWSTMNSSGPFAFVMSSALLLLLSNPVRFRLPMFALGVASLLLSLVRAAWLGLLLGVAYLLFALRGANRLRLVTFTAIGVFVLSVSIMSGPLGKIISDRFSTLYELDDDGSYQQRQDFYADFLMRSITNVVGEGIGSTSYVTKLDHDGEISSGFYGDSGVMQIPFVLGWLGTMLYIGGLAALLKQIVTGAGLHHDAFVQASKAIVLMTGAEMIFENTLINVMGMCFWVFMAMCLAAKQYYAAQAGAQFPVALPSALPTPPNFGSG